METSSLRKCCKCKKFFAKSFFQRDKQVPDGLSRRCKTCEKEKRKRTHIKRREKDSEYGKEYYQMQKKEISLRIEIYRLSDPDRERERGKRWRTKNKEKIAEYLLNYAKINKQKIIDYHKKWYQKNIERFFAASAKRRAQKLRATPKWANDFFINEIYQLARLREKITGIRWHVDHIVPLQGKNVCGLHVENNLSVIPAILNMKKGNRYVT